MKLWWRAAKAKPDPTSSAPTASVVADSVRDRTLLPSGTKVSVSDLVSYLQQADQGETRPWFAFCDEMRARDAFLDAEMSKAEAMVAGARVDVLAVPASLRSRSKTRTGDAARAAEVASYVQEILLAPHVGLDRAVGALMGGFWKGLAALELVVEPVAQGERIVSLRPIPAQRFLWATGEDTLLVQPGEEWGTTVPVADLGASLITFVPEGSTPSPARRGAFRRLVPYFEIRTMGHAWWARDVELYGLPLMLGLHPAGDEKTASFLRRLLGNLGSRGWAVGPVGTKIEPVQGQARGSGESPHEAILDWTSRQISVQVLGATQTTDVAKDTGSKASAGVHQETVYGKASARARLVAACLREQLVFPLVERRFGREVAMAHTPELAFRVEPRPDLGIWAKAMSDLVTAGFSEAIPRSLVNEVGFAPEPEEGEPTLGPPKAPAAAPPQAEPPDVDEPEPEPEPEPQEASRRRRAASSGRELVSLEAWALAQARGAGEELVAEVRAVIDQAQKEGVTLPQLMARVIQLSPVPPDAPELVDLLAAVQLEATMRGFVGARR